MLHNFGHLPDTKIPNPVFPVRCNVLPFFVFLGKIQAGREDAQYGVGRGLTGQVMATTSTRDLPEGAQQLSVDNLENLSPGMYFLSVVLDEKVAKTVKVYK
jgi:hypothetical protein